MGLLLMLCTQETQRTHGTQRSVFSTTFSDELQSQCVRRRRRRRMTQGGAGTSLHHTHKVSPSLLFSPTPPLASLPKEYSSLHCLCLPDLSINELLPQDAVARSSPLHSHPHYAPGLFSFSSFYHNITIMIH